MAGDGRQNADAVLVAALATGSTRQEAAKAAGVGERTVYRRRETSGIKGSVTQKVFGEPQP